MSSTAENQRVNLRDQKISSISRTFSKYNLKSFLKTFFNRHTYEKRKGGLYKVFAEVLKYLDTHNNFMLGS